MLVVEPLRFLPILVRTHNIGNELDLVAEYQLNKGLNLGFGYARMFAGQFLKTTTPGHDYS
jgi:hypothetical protein